MFRLIFIVIGLVPYLGATLLFFHFSSRERMDWFMDHGPFPISAIVYTVTLLFAYYWFLDKVRPPSDKTRIKVRLEQLGGASVLNIIPFGLKLGGRSSPDYRVYRARVREADGTENNRTVDVEVSLFGSGTVIDRTNHSRTISALVSDERPLVR